MNAPSYTREEFKELWCRVATLKYLQKVLEIGTSDLAPDGVRCWGMEHLRQRMARYCQGDDQSYDMITEQWRILSWKDYVLVAVFRMYQKTFRWDMMDNLPDEVGETIDWLERLIKYKHDVREEAEKANVTLPKKRYSNPKGYVYLVRSVSGNWKIGHTTNVQDRVHTFNVKLPFEVELEHVIKCQDRRVCERRLHGMFEDERVNGEWFALKPEHITFIKSLRTDSDF